MRRIAIGAILLCSLARAQGPEMTLAPDGTWVAVERPAPNADQRVMLEARTDLAAGRSRKAKRALDLWLEKHELDDAAQLPEAYLLRGDAKAAVGSEYRALYDYEAVIKDFAATPEFVTAVERELEIGIRYVNGLRRHFLGLRVVNAEDVGEELLVRTAERMPRSRLAERAILELGDYYYRTRDLKYAALTYEIFLYMFPRSEHATWVRQQRIFASIGMFKGPDYDAAGLADAKVLIEDYAQDDPIGARRANLSDALLSKLDESMAVQMLEKARFYIRRGDPVSARAALRRLVKDHPRSVAAVEAEKMLKDRGWTLATPAAAPAGGAGTSPADRPTQEPKP